ncbi:MAG: substrate-binding periplasmic protein [[Eubacterium] siraeum]
MTKYEPYNFSDKNGNPAGIDVEIASEAFLRMGYKAQFKNIVWDEKDEMLTDGKVDCLRGCFSMNGRRRQVPMGRTLHMNSRQAVAVRADSNIYALSDLSGKRVAVQSSSKPEEMLSQKSDDIPQVSGLYCFVRTEYIFAALRKNYVDAVAGHEYMLRVFINESDNKYRLLDESLLLSKLGIAFAKDNDSALPEKLESNAL